MQTNVLEYLEQSAERWPDAPAYVDETASVTFGQLLQRAQGIGTALCGLTGPQRPVAVLTQRSIACIHGFFGALFAGCYYVPIDSTMPRKRMEDILTQLSPAAILYGPEDAALAADLTAFGPTVSIEEAWQTAPDPATLRQARAAVLDVDPVYVIFTSGSTGTPKGILVSHRSVIDFTDWYAGITGVTEEDRLGNQAPFFFDLSVKDLYLTLKTGAATCVLPKKCFLFPTLLIQKLNDEKITTLSWATSAFHLVAGSGVLQKHTPQYLKRVLLGGEALQAKHLNTWRAALPAVDYVNLYGPTETTVDCTYYPIRRTFADTEPIPIGTACANMEVLLLDEHGKPVPDGQPGEICVRGSGLAIGYYGEWEKTARAFVQNLLNPAYPDRMYRTGDLGRRDEDGNIVFLARQDNQIKHMGYRIELGEIETALISVPAVENAVCMFDEQRDKLVCCYCGDIAEGDLAKALRDRLPKYMIPNVYHRLDRLPQTANGKVDRPGLKKEFLS